MHDVMERQPKCSLVVTIVHGVQRKHIVQARVGHLEVIMDVVQQMEIRQYM